MKKVFNLLIVVFFVIGHTTEINAQSADITEGCFPLTVNFTAPSGHATHYWDFKESSTANIPNPSNTFLNAGTYEVEFKETFSGPVIGTVTINVYPKPVPSFSITNGQGCAPLSVDFMDTTVLSNGITITDYSWVYSNSGNSTGANPTYNFTSAGSYDVSLTITTNFPSCNTSKQYFNVINASTPPIVNFLTTPFPAISCTVPLNVSFQNLSSSATGPLVYDWDFGNGNTSTDVTPLTQTYNTVGDFTIKLVATDTNGCANFKEYDGSIGQPEASFAISDTLCINTPYTLTNLSPSGNYSWVFDAGTIPSTSTLTDPVFTISTPGYHDITLNIIGPCNDDTTITVYVEEVDATFTSTPSFACSSPMDVQFTPNDLNAASYTWFLGNDSVSNLVSPSVTYYTDDSTEYLINGPDPHYYFTTSLTIISNFGCSATFVSTDTLHEPNAMIIPDIVDGCVPVTVNFNDSSISFSDIVNWEWHFGDGTVINASNDQNQTHVYNSIGVYDAFIIITNANGCKDTSYLVPISVGDVMTPDFSVSPTSICRGENISLTDITTGPLADSIDTWHYYAENARMFSCQNQQNPSWTYRYEAGPQNITMVVGYNGCFSEVTKTAIVDVKGPVATMNYSIDCTTPFLVNFTDQSQDITSLAWDFGDGNTSNLENPPSFQYASSGTYTISLLANNVSTATSITVDSTPFPEPQFSITLSEECGKFPLLELTNLTTGTNTYVWDFGDGNTSTAKNPPPFRYSANGTYLISLEANDGRCQKVETKSTNIELLANLQAIFSATLIAECGEAPFIELINHSSGTNAFSWDFGDGDTSSKTNPIHVFTNTGTYNVLLIVESEFGCVDSANKVIEISPTPVADFQINGDCEKNTVDFVDNSIVASGNIVNWDWQFGDGSTSNQPNENHVYQNADLYTVTLIVETDNGCIDTTELIHEIYPTPTAIFTVTDNCVDAPVSIINSSNISSNTVLQYAWDFANGTSSVQEDPIGLLYTADGTYLIVLMVTSVDGCSDQDTNWVVAHPNPVASIKESALTGCDPFETRMTNDLTPLINNCVWTFGDGSESDFCGVVNHTYQIENDTVSKYDVYLTVSSAFGCTDTAYYKDFITVNKSPKADFTFSPQELTTKKTEVIFTNQSLFSHSYEWHYNENIYLSELKNPVHVFPKEAGIYGISLKVGNKNSTCFDTEIKSIVIYDQLIYYVPNAFTPNENNFNEFFQPVFTSGYDVYAYKLTIFNRWGEIIFVSHDASVGWDGTYAGGKVAESEVYVWQIEFSDRRIDQQYVERGTVMLIK